MSSVVDWKHAAVRYAEAHKFPVPSDFKPERPAIGQGFRVLLQDVQAHAGIHPHDGALNEATMKVLTKYLPKPSHPQITARGRLVREFWWGIGNSEKIAYAEIRPMPLKAWKDRRPLATDCSGSYTCACYAAGLSDPNGYHFDGSGNTNSLLAHMRHITRAQALPGDAVIFGYPGVTEHVAAFLEPGTHPDPMVFNHGRTGLPDEPLAERLSGLTEFFSETPIWFVSPFS